MTRRTTDRSLELGVFAKSHWTNCSWSNHWASWSCKLDVWTSVRLLPAPLNGVSACQSPVWHFRCGWLSSGDSFGSPWLECHIRHRQPQHTPAPARDIIWDRRSDTEVAKFLRDRTIAGCGFPWRDISLFNSDIRELCLSGTLHYKYEIWLIDSCLID